MAHLPNSVEQLLERLRLEKSAEPADALARRELARVGEQQAIEILGKISRAGPIRRSLSRYIMYMVQKYGNVQVSDPKTPERRRPEPVRSQESVNFSGLSSPNFNPFRDDTSAASSSGGPQCEESPGQPGSASIVPRQLAYTCSPPTQPVSTLPLPPQQLVSIMSPKQPPSTVPSGEAPSAVLKALGHLDFRKAFLILSYAGSNKLDEVLSVDSIMEIKGLPMVRFEQELWNIVKDNKQCMSESDRRKNVDWESRSTHMYHCHVGSNGCTAFKGPFLQDTSTHLHRVLGDDNVLMVKFAAEDGYSVHDYFHTYHRIAQEGITLGLRRYQFFVFKDGAKEKKKSATSSPVKCYFVRTMSNWHMDVNGNKPYILFNKSIHEARSIFMHVHTVSNLAKHMARFSLILSKTIKVGINFETVHIRWIKDIPCLDEEGRTIQDENGEEMIHTDGTGFISEDLAKKCPRRIQKGRDTTPKDIEKFLDKFQVTGKDSSIKELLSLSDEPPLLVQIRLFYDGYAVKGTLLVDKRLPPETICVRRSMVKVDPDPSIESAQHCNSLELVGTSNLPRRSYLSKSIIALLQYGGVPRDYFLKLALNAISNAVLGQWTKRSALRVALMYGNMDDFLPARMILSGIPLDDPYLQSRLSVMMREEWNNLKAGKIPVSDSYNLMGTADPAGTLEQNEVCIILDNGQVCGDVLVYKHPGLHFGDIHVLKAVYNRDIEKIVGNCKYAIFFPTKGPRSLADEMANSDYDGDLYWVSRDPQLLQAFKASEPWKWRRSRPKVPQQKKPTEFSSAELERALFHNFLINRFNPSYAMSEASDSWMAFMDRLLTPTVRASEKPYLREKILELTDKYYHALDAQKKGQKVTVAKHMQSEECPHFLERSNKPSFRSTSILGLIYNEVTSFQVEERLLTKVSPLPCLAESAPQHCLELWTKRYAEYRKEMTQAVGEKDEKLKKSAADNIIRKYKLMLYGAEEFEKSTRNQADVLDEALAIYQIVYNYVDLQMEKKGSKCGFAWKVAGHALFMLHAKKQTGDSTIIVLKSVIQEIL